MIQPHVCDLTLALSARAGYKITNSSLGPIVSAYRLLAEDSYENCLAA